MDFQTKNFRDETTVYTPRPVSGGAIANTGSMQQSSILTDQAVHSHEDFISISFTNAQMNDNYDVVCPTVQPMVNVGRNKNIIWDYSTIKMKKSDADVNPPLVEHGYENLTPRRQCSDAYVDFRITRWRFDGGPLVASPLSVLETMLSRQHMQLASEGPTMGVQALLSEQQDDPKLSDEDITSY